MTSDPKRRAEIEQFRKLDAAFHAGDLAALRAAADDPDVVPNGPMPPAIGSCLNDYTPLHMAVAERNLPAVRVLLEGGADPRLRTRIDDCETAREMAEQVGHREIIELLAARETQVAREEGQR